MGLARAGTPRRVLAVVFLLGFGRLGVSSEHRRKAAVTLLGLLAAANLIGIRLVLGSLVGGGAKMTGPQLLATAAVVLLVNVITFALVFWEVDSDGPVSRALADSRVTPDFQFPQDENPAARKTDWTPALRTTLHRGDELDRVQPHRRDAADPPGEAVHGHRVAHRGGDRAHRRRPGGQHPPGLIHTDLLASPAQAAPRTRRLDESHLEISRKENRTMRLTKVRMLLATVTALALMVGVGTAIAATGRPDPEAGGRAHLGRTCFDAAVAKNLGTTTAKLNAAIKAAATARINAALAAGDITADEADDPEGCARRRQIPAIRLATAATVAKELNTTEAKLNAAYASAQKAQAMARVDAALKPGRSPRPTRPS